MFLVPWSPQPWSKRRGCPYNETFHLSHIMLLFIQGSLEAWFVISSHLCPCTEPGTETRLSACGVNEVFACMHAKSLQSCLTLCDLIDSSPQGSSVHRRQEYWSGLPFPSPNEVFRRLCFSHILTLKGLDNSETTKVKHRVNNFPATQGGSNASLSKT